MKLHPRLETALCWTFVFALAAFYYLVFISSFTLRGYL